jgi:hypothetical protein
MSPQLLAKGSAKYDPRKIQSSLQQYSDYTHKYFQ